MHKVSPMMARKHAVARHSAIEQKYGIHPYSFHLDRAAEVLERWNRWNNLKGIANVRFIATCLYLHDVREDTGATEQDLADMFGQDVAHVVSLVTRGETETLDEYLERIKTDIRACLVKICDSMTNLDHSVYELSPTRVAKYSRVISELVSHVNGFVASYNQTPLARADEGEA